MLDKGTAVFRCSLSGTASRRLLEVPAWMFDRLLSARWPVDIPMAAYTNLGCAGLAQELVKERTTLASLSKQQNQSATGDAVGVFLIGAPASSTFGGDKEGQVAVSKGKLNAIESAMKSKSCK